MVVSPGSSQSVCEGSESAVCAEDRGAAYLDGALPPVQHRNNSLKRFILYRGTIDCTDDHILFYDGGQLDRVNFCHCHGTQAQ